MKTYLQAGSRFGAITSQQFRRGVIIADKPSLTDATVVEVVTHRGSWGMNQPKGDGFKNCCAYNADRYERAGKGRPFQKKVAFLNISFRQPARMLWFDCPVQNGPYTNHDWHVISSEAWQGAFKRKRYRPILLEPKRIRYTTA